MEHSDGVTSWDTVGVAPNIVEASWVSLTDGITYGLMRRGVEVR
jgi:2-isopropylmalate synthase